MQDKAVGIMVGGAFGDSFGAATEFMSLSTIRSAYGPEGVSNFEPAFGYPPGVITDDTQMAMATARGLVKSPDLKDSEATIKSIYAEYLKWYETQSDPSESRAPGSTCTSALRSGQMGVLDRPINASKGCGAIMRAHPIGIAYRDSPELAFEMGMRSGVITHGHPDAYMPAGFMACLIARLLNKEAYESALNETIFHMANTYGEGQTNGTFGAIDSALGASKTDDPCEVIDQSIGVPPGEGGWQGHNALAIALYAIRREMDDVVAAVRIAVNHSGDTDSTGSMCGAILGAIYGASPFNDELSRQAVELEHHSELCHLAHALVR